MLERVLTVVILAIGMSGCARRVPEAAHVLPGTPYVTWIIMHGDRDNPDAEFACQSDLLDECIVPASRADAQVLSDVHIYYHGVGRETKYVGSVRVGFFRSAVGSAGAPTSMTVRGDKEVVNQSFTGLVTDTPGRYALTFALDASLSDVSGSQPIREEVSVLVR